MRNKGARLGRDADAREALVDLAVQRRERIVRLDPGPDHVRPPLPLEQADTSNPRRNARRMERAERRRDVLCHMAVDLADEPQRQMELLVILPARARDAVHRREQYVADRTRRAQRDEQAVRGHGGQHNGRGFGSRPPNRRAGNNIALVRFRLKQEGKRPILLSTAGMGWPMME